MTHPMADAHSADERRQDTRPRLVVAGIGGAGCNAVNRMIDAGLSGVDMIAMNTDRDALSLCQSPLRLPLGPETTEGLGAGGDPKVGCRAAEESRNEIRRSLQGAQMVFLAAGMGGGTGTGAMPVVADIAASLGILTVAVVTKPFTFEGPRRKRNAEAGIDELKGRADTVIVVANDRLLDGCGAGSMPLIDAFRIADDVLRQGVQGISDIITVPGSVNVDFADVKATLSQAGTAMMGIGEAEGEGRAITAARRAAHSPLLDTSINGALRVLINMTSGPDLKLAEFYEAASMIQDLCDPKESRFIFGWVLDPAMEGKVRVTVLATGFAQPDQRPVTPIASQELRPQPQQVPVRPVAMAESSPISEPADTSDGREQVPVTVQSLLTAGSEAGEPDYIIDEHDLDTPALYRRR